MFLLAITAKCDVTILIITNYSELQQQFSKFPKQITQQKFKITWYLHSWTSFTDKFGHSESDVLHSELKGVSCAAHARSTTYRMGSLQRTAMCGMEPLPGATWDPKPQRSDPRKCLQHHRGFEYEPGKRQLGSILQTILKLRQARPISKASLVPAAVPRVSSDSDALSGPGHHFSLIQGSHSAVLSSPARATGCCPSLAQEGSRPGLVPAPQQGTGQGTGPREPHSPNSYRLLRTPHMPLLSLFPPAPLPFVTARARLSELKASHQIVLHSPPLHCTVSFHTLYKFILNELMWFS